MKYMSHMKTIIKLSIILLVCMSCIHKRDTTFEWKYNYPMPVSIEEYEADKKYFVECFINNVEYYRLYHRFDTQHKNTESYKKHYEKYPDAEYDNEGIPPGLYLTYALKFTDRGPQRSNIPTNKRLEVIVDTILYSRDAKFSFIFYAVRDKAPDAVTLIGDNATGYTAMAMIGYKEKEHALPKFYPISEEAVFSYDYEEAIHLLEYQFVTQLSSRWIGGDAYPLKPFGVNVNEHDFFEKAAYFEKYNDSTYKFQMQRGVNVDEKMRGDTVLKLSLIHI